MDWQTLHEKLAEHHFSNPQNAKLAELALDGAKAAVEQLARLGHVFHLVEASAVTATAPLVEYPKMLYHSGLGQKVVESLEEELEAVKAGWRNSQQPEPEPAEPEPVPAPAPVPPVVTKTLAPPPVTPAPAPAAGKPGA